MADAKAHRAALNGGGGFIRWDWSKNKYVYVGKSDVAKQSESRMSVAPSPYEKNVAVLKNKQHKQYKQSNQPSFKVPVKKAYRQPLKTSNKQLKLPAKGHRVSSPPKKKNPVAGHQPVRREDLIKIRERFSKENEAGHQAGGLPNVEAPPDEILAGHGTFVSIISNRLIHMNAALTFWRQNPGSLITYLIRTADDSVTVGILPMLSVSLVRQTPKSKLISMGAWLEFLPTLHKLLSSKFADYIKVCLDLIRTLLRHWSKALEKQKISQSSALLQSQSVCGIYSGMVAMTDTVSSLAERKGSVGKKAKVVKELLDKL